MHCTLYLDLYTAVLGGNTLIRTLKGPVKMNIAKETQNGKVLRMKGMGMPKYGKENEFGDLYAKVSIQIPTKLSEKERELFNELYTLNKTHYADTI